jgi:hypothetical protein
MGEAYQKSSEMQMLLGSYFGSKSTLDTLQQMINPHAIRKKDMIFTQRNKTILHLKHFVTA